MVGSNIADLTDDGLMAAMQAVKIPQRDDSAARLSRKIRVAVKRPHLSGRPFLYEHACIPAADFHAVNFAMTFHFHPTRPLIDLCDFGNGQDFIADHGGLTETKIKFNENRARPG